MGNGKIRQWFGKCDSNNIIPGQRVKTTLPAHTENDSGRVENSRPRGKITVFPTTPTLPPLLCHPYLTILTPPPLLYHPYSITPTLPPLLYHPYLIASFMSKDIYVRRLCASECCERLTGRSRFERIERTDEPTT